jgi:biotin-dependent carboxylase-like uncharacterized protein
VIEVLNATELVTVQDQGRFGYSQFGVGRAGAMDGLALKAGNLLLGNDPDAAGIEVPLSAFSIRFHAECAIALTGAEAEAWLDDEAIPGWWARSVQTGQVLTLAPARRGSHVYVAVAGGIAVPRVLGSRSTQLRGAFGGLEGRGLRAGDRLPLGNSDRQPAFCDFGVRPPLPAGQVQSTLRVIPAGEYAYLTTAAQAEFWRVPWRVSHRSNRAGYRLDGPVLEMARQVEMRSHGIVPGVVQLPAGGTPIVQLADAITMGGYPKLGTVIGADLWHLAQVRPGESVRFHRASWDDAIQAEVANAAFLREVEVAARRAHAAARCDIAQFMPVREIARLMRAHALCEVQVEADGNRLRLQSAPSAVEPVTAPHAGKILLSHRGSGNGCILRAGAMLARIETEAGLIAVRAPFDGIVRRWRVGEGDTVPVGTILLEMTRSTPRFGGVSAGQR